MSILIYSLISLTNQGSFSNVLSGAGELAKWLRELAALTDDLSLVPSTTQ